MAKNSSVDQAALAFKILDGKASPEEQHAFDMWLSQSQEHWEEFADLKLLWENSNYRSTDNDPDAFKQIKRIVEKDRTKKRILRYVLYLIGMVVASATIYIATSRLIARQSVDMKFNDATIDYVIRQIEKTYKIEIECDDAIRVCRFSGIFYRNDEPETVLRAMAKSMNIQVLKLATNKFKLTGKGC